MIHSCDAAEFLSWLRLTLVPGVSPRVQRELVDALGSAAAVLDAPSATVAGLADDECAQALARGPDARWLARALAWLENPSHHHLVTWASPLYPPLLREIADPPLVLYALGDATRLSTTAIAIVGSRNCTPVGAQDAREFARALSMRSLCVVSGLAAGIDAAAHSGGLEGPGSTVAVMGTGPDRFYPSRNAALGEEIAARGCVVSEFAPGTPSLPGNFPRRNRLISGLSRGVLVVEAARHSGSLITARAAVEQNREVFAIPGSIHSPMSKGCHLLIRDGAKLVENAEDVLSELRGEAQAVPRAPDEHVETTEPPLLKALGHGPMSVDQLATLTGLAAAGIAAGLSRLEVEGRVNALPGGWFQRAPGRS